MSIPLIVQSAPKHGGNALELCAQYGLSLTDCIDLTAAINPEPYPVGELPQSIWQALPQEQDGLMDAAAAYYGLNLQSQNAASSLLMVPGSTWAIHALPIALAGALPDQPELHCQINQASQAVTSVTRRRVWVPQQGFSEHAYAWQQNGCALCRYTSMPGVSAALLAEIAASISNMNQGDVVVLINPNNPTGQLWTQEQVLALLASVTARNGWLVVDEAFMDVTPQHSVIQHDSQNLIVMRSFGKFFGLAGLRVGAIKAPVAVIERLAQQLPPWSMNAPARYLAKQAYTDLNWQQRSRERLHSAQSEVVNALTHLSQTTQGRLVVTPLFYTLYLNQAKRLHCALAQQGVLTRLLDDHSGVRLGRVAPHHIQRALRAFSQVEL